VRRLSFSEPEDVPAAITSSQPVLAAGGVLLVPTESFYGLAVDPDDRGAVERVHVMKERPQGMALPVLCADWQQVERLVVVPDAYRVRLSRSWPGPLTVILPLRRALPAGQQGTLAVRIPGHAMLRALLYRVGPVTGTSANRHGSPPSADVDGALASLAFDPDLVLDAGLIDGGRPSTLVSLVGETPVVLRKGSYDWGDFYAGVDTRVC
jgi:L-threonylcarbamoyladenylate synthase